MKGVENLSRKVTPEVINKLIEICGKDDVNTGEMDRLLYAHEGACVRTPVERQTRSARQKRILRL